MTRKRDYIAEILDTRTRAYKRADRWQQFTRRNEAIIDAEGFLSKGKGNHAARVELLKYISIGTVACVEAYFRMAVRDLIEHGSPFEQNARKLQDIKLELATILDMRREKISHGEFIAHLLPLNNLDDINRHVSVLIGSSFLDDLKDIEIPEFGMRPLELIPGLYERMKELFTQRHIYCHEIAMKVKPTFEKEGRILAATIIFVNASDRLIERLLTK